MQRCLIWTLWYRCQRIFQFSSCFEPIDVITLCTHWWPQLHSTCHQPQVSSIYFLRFLWFSTIPSNKGGQLSKHLHCKQGKRWAIVVVKWSAYSPSTLTIRVRIQLKPTVFSVKLCLIRTNINKKEAGVGRFLNKDKQAGWSSCGLWLEWTETQ